MSETAAKKDLLKLQRAIVDGLEDIKAQDIRVFNTEHLSPLFERVIVATGSSNRQTKALAASVRDKVREAGFAKPRMEGEDNAEWIIVDCGPAVAHVMQPAIRQYYKLEEIWGEKPVRLKSAAPVVRRASDAAPAARKTAASPPVAKKTAAAAAAKPSAAAKTPASKAPAKKAKATAPATETPANKAPAKKATAKKAPAKKAVAKTSASARAPGKAAARPTGATAAAKRPTTAKKAALRKKPV
ncbi:MAG TPA: ribosome silencing factor [Ottowia sp.]|nr:ribosome silencing factor [Ottowia sp.]HON30817.1 ribosome silencing factor [Ottowia sp.]HQX68311.1 ribosome silencing factor [Ottowia sp.]HRB10508.1 ribosome silencing factor [Ottowia sp.]